MFRIWLCSHLCENVQGYSQTWNEGEALYSAIFSSHFGISFLRQFGDNVGHSFRVSHQMRAYLQMNTCHAHTATVFPEDVCRACTFRPLCASNNCSAGPLKHGAFKFERRWPKREGGGQNVKGRSATLLWWELWYLPYFSGIIHAYTDVLL